MHIEDGIDMRCTINNFIIKKSIPRLENKERAMRCTINNFIIKRSIPRLENKERLREDKDEKNNKTRFDFTVGSSIE